jgi:hypothetical protein
MSEKPISPLRRRMLDDMTPAAPDALSERYRPIDPVVLAEIGAPVRSRTT